jgi:ubiquinone/menaquinone biosynthesis C-methylase UbiE
MDDCLRDFIEGSYIGFWDGAHMQILNQLEKNIISKQLASSASWFVELGCGQGRLLPEYINKAHNIVVVDYALLGLEQIEEAYSSYDHIHCIAADIKRLPFRESVFDAGLCIRMVNNYPFLDETMSEISRIFKNRATIVLSYFNRRNLLRIFKHGRKCFEKTHKFDFKGAFGLMCATHPVFFKRMAEKHHLFIKSNLGSGFIYQITHNFSWLQKRIETHAAFRNLLAGVSRFVDLILGKLDFSLWQFVQLERKDNATGFPTGLKIAQLLDVLCCPVCKKGDIIELTAQIQCTHCKAMFMKRGKIYDFRRPIGSK